MTPESDINVLTPYVTIAGTESRGLTAGAVCSCSSEQEAISKAQRRHPPILRKEGQRNIVFISVRMSSNIINIRLSFIKSR